MLKQLASLIAISILLANHAYAQTNDPFDASKERPTQAAPKKKNAVAGLIDFKVAVEPPQVKRGEIARLTITGTPREGHYTYSFTKKTADQGGVGFMISLLESPSATPGIRPLGPITESEPELKHSSDQVHYVQTKPFKLTQDLLVLDDAKPGPVKLPLTVRLQVCNKSSCVPGVLALEADFEVSNDAPVKISDDVEKRPEQRKTESLLVKASAAAPAPSSATKEMSPNDARRNSAGLLPLLGSAFFGAFLMLLTPCVFPMIPITVNFFLKQSEKEHHRPLAMASVYSGTIIVVLSLAVLLLGKVIINLANSPWFNLALGIVLIIFAFSLFGMYEIGLPSFLTRFTSSRESQGGHFGAIFMALTFTITSFTCTGPFLALLMAPVAGLQPPVYHLVLAALVYSATFAAPFFLLALFPTLLKALPKSGGWLNAIKVSMGFVELGAALKFLANSDYYWNPGHPRIFTYDAVLCAWIALSIACGLYLLGVFRLPHDSPVEYIGVVRMVVATIFFGFALYMTPALWRERPQGIVGDGIIAFLPPTLDNLKKRGGGGSDSAHLAWHLDYDAAWKEARATKKPIFIDFTGVFCTNCRSNEETVFPRPEIHGLLAKYVRVQLYTDTVPNPNLSASEAKAEADRNARWRDAIGDPTNPYYVLFQPDLETPLNAEGLLNGAVLDTRKGTIYDTVDFASFLGKHAPRGVAVANPPWSGDLELALAKARMANEDNRPDKKLVLVNFP